MQESFVFLSAALVSVLGFLLSYKIYQKKQVAGPLVCPLRANCDRVIRSSHSKIFGVSLEWFGMFYHVVGFLFYVGTFLFAVHIPLWAVFMASIATLFSFIFSLYLTAVQLFVLKSWCSWCMGSALLATINFILIYFVSDLPIISLLETHRRIILIVHILAVSLGMGGALITDMLFFKFLKDYQISEAENTILETLSNAIWIALLILLVSGVGIYLPKIAQYNDTPKFLAKMSVIVIITINGFLLNKMVTPKLTSLRFDVPQMLDPKLNRIRAISFALGAISLTSWLTAFVFAMLKNLPHSYGELMGIYGAILIVMITGSQIAHYLFTHKKIEL
ncbi:MAG: vitamin K epoxide reductase family protein [bacterium]